jgi:di/tricarboxylate transporter
MRPQYPLPIEVSQEQIMGSITLSQASTWGIAAVATGGVILRPWGAPEAIWAVLGAFALVALTLVPVHDAFAAIAKGSDVYLFLAGMMLLAELARQEGLFDWLAVHAMDAAKGSPVRLFGLVYLAGIAVTAFLSNDTTAVVLTPAVYTVAKAAKVKPLPYLVACAMIANAASFVLPISNPANLVFTAITCRRSGPGSSNLHCRRCSQSPQRISSYVFTTARISRAKLQAMFLTPSSKPAAAMPHAVSP